MWIIIQLGSTVDCKKIYTIGPKRMLVFHIKKHSTLLGVIGLITYFILVIRTTAHLGPLGWDEAVRSMGGIVLYRLFIPDKPLVEIVQLLYVNHQLATSQAAIYGPVQALISFVSYLLFGISPFTARLPSAVFGTLGLYVCYRLGSEIYHDKRVGLFSAIFLAGSLTYFAESCLNWSDLLVIVFISIGVYFVVLLKRNCEENSNLGKRKLYLYSLLSGLSLSSAALIKLSGAVILLPIGVYIGLFLIRNRTQKKNILLLSLPIFAVISTIILYLCSLYLFSSLISIADCQPLDVISGYIQFHSGRAGHPLPVSTLSFDVWANFWKPILWMLPVPLSLLSVIGIFYALGKRNDENLLLACYATFFFLAIAIAGTIAPTYPLGALPALCILGARILIDAWDYFNEPKGVISDKRTTASRSLMAVFIFFLVVQSIYVPIATSLAVTFQSPEELSQFDPYVIRKNIRAHTPFLFSIDTGYCKYSDPLNPRLSRQSRWQMCPEELAAKMIVQDATKAHIPDMTVVIVDDGINTIHFEFWFMALDTNITYTSKIIKPGELLDCLSKDETIRYIVTSATSLPDMYQNEYELYFTMENVNVFKKIR